jgi:TRAP transporter TAXI family solute receptor
VAPAIIEKTRPLFHAVSIPANSYAGQTTEVATAGLNNYFVTTSDAPDDIVYGITKAIFSNLTALHAAHPAASVISAENALSVQPIKVHPGAARYFREAGLLH